MRVKPNTTSKSHSKIKNIFEIYLMNILVYLKLSLYLDMQISKTAGKKGQQL